METTVITTPSGYKVTINTQLTYGLKRQLQRVFISSAKIDPAQPDKFDFDAGAMFDAQDLAVKLLVTDIEVAGKHVQEHFLDTILSWPEADGQAVYDKINELTQDTTPVKKGA